MGKQGHSNIVCGANISRLSSTRQFLLCSSGVLILYLLYGYVQEKLFRIEGFRTHGWFLTLIQFVCVTILSAVDHNFISKQPRRKEQSPFHEYCVLAWLTVGTMGLSTVSLGYLNFPTQVIFKSCKLIPVMLGGIIILGKKYKMSEYCSVLLMSVGLVLFSLADQTVSPEFNPKGIILICMALAVDAVYGNYQERFMKNHPNVSNAEIVLYSYSFGTVMVFTWLTATGQMRPALVFSLKHPEVYNLGVVYAAIGYLGNQLILALIKSSGALVSTIVTTMRKMITIVLSFMFFTKPFTFQYVWSGGLVLLGISISIYSKNKDTIHQMIFKGRLSVKNFVKSHSAPISGKRTLLEV